MNTILTIAALVAGMTAYEIVKAIVAHAKAKDEIKLIEAKLREEEARKSAAEIENKSEVFPGDKPCWSYSGLGEITHWCEQIPLPQPPKEGE